MDQPHQQHQMIKVLKIDGGDRKGCDVSSAASSSNSSSNSSNSSRSSSPSSASASDSGSASARDVLYDPIIDKLLSSTKGGKKTKTKTKTDDDACSECSSQSTHMSDELVLKGCMYTILNRFLSADTEKHGPQTVAKSLERIATALEAIQRSLPQPSNSER